MKKLLLALLPLVSFGQMPNYWQQEVQYVMDIDMDVEKHQFEGTQKLTYTNNSPDTLTEVYYHLYFNAFQPFSMMDERARHITDPDKRIGERIVALNQEERGWHKVESLHQDGVLLRPRVVETILIAELAKPLAPGESTVLEMKFNSQVPVQIRRSGRNNAEGVDYTMTQWYPKMAAYDENGWHPDPYIAREFYAPFGSFEVNITIDAKYKIGGTGVLQNEENYWEKKPTGTGLVNMQYKRGDKDHRTWTFKADKVHDFAWAADPAYLRLQNNGPDDLELNYYFLPKYSNTWEELPGYTAEFFTNMNEQFGEYAYRQFSVIQGGDGGMEYPMCTMLKGTGKLRGLVGVMAHESAHNWYYGMMASNENRYPWMDEGFTSFAENEALNRMSGEPKPNPHLGAYANYNYMIEKGFAEPLSTPADYFTRNKTYGITAYSQGTIFLNQLRYIVGTTAFQKGMMDYYDQWKFKHPDPYDFIRVMEEASDLRLDWYINLWMNTTKTIDYGIKEVKAQKEQTMITLERIGEMPMPVDITIYTKNGTQYEYNVPLLSMMGSKKEPGITVASDPWPWTSPTFEISIPYPMESIASIVIDKYHETADIDMENNVYSLVEEEEEKKAEQ